MGQAKVTAAHLFCVGKCKVLVQHFRNSATLISAFFIKLYPRETSYARYRQF